MNKCEECLFLALCLSDIIVKKEKNSLFYSIAYPKRMFDCCSKDPINMIHARDFLFNLKRMYI